MIIFPEKSNSLLYCSAKKDKHGNLGGVNRKYKLSHYHLSFTITNVLQTDNNPVLLIERIHSFYSATAKCLCSISFISQFFLVQVNLIVSLILSVILKLHTVNKGFLKKCE